MHNALSLIALGKRMLDSVEEYHPSVGRKTVQFQGAARYMERTHHRPANVILRRECLIGPLFQRKVMLDRASRG
jgi:hypothetical protein